MGSIDVALATELRDRLDLKRAVETGTYQGITARRLATIFGEVVTIELSKELHESASRALRPLPNVRALQGDSAERLRELAAETPTLFFLDGHWSGGATAGVEHECPVLGELAALEPSHPSDVIVIDDARHFMASPPPPSDPTHWPTFMELYRAIGQRRPDHLVTVINDQIIVHPAAAKPAVDAYAQRLQHMSWAKAKAVAARNVLTRIGVALRARRSRP
jgi:predicted O-methyltransferase YrrM